MATSQARALLNGNLSNIHAEATQATASYLKAEEIYPVLHIGNIREVWHIISQAGCVKVCFDAVRHTNVDRTQSVEEYELELELKAGPNIFLQEIAQALSQQYELRSNPHSKYERGVSLLNVFTPTRWV